MMNATFANNSVIHTKNMLIDYDVVNETSSELVGDNANDTISPESQDYDVQSYLESILGPQRQPSEKVRPFLCVPLSGLKILLSLFYFNFSMSNKYFLF